MILTHFLIAILLAVLFTVLLIPLGGHRTRREEHGAGLAFLFFLLIFLPFIWAGGLWLTPFGPMMHGVAWMPFFLVGLLVMLLLLVTLPDASSRTGNEEPFPEADPETEGDEKAVKAFGAAYLVLLAGLAILIVASYAGMG